MISKMVLNNTEIDRMVYERYLTSFVEYTIIMFPPMDPSDCPKIDLQANPKTQNSPKLSLYLSGGFEVTLVTRIPHACMFTVKMSCKMYLLGSLVVTLGAGILHT